MRRRPRAHFFYLFWSSVGLAAVAVVLCVCWFVLFVIPSLVWRTPACLLTSKARGGGALTYLLFLRSKGERKRLRLLPCEGKKEKRGRPKCSAKARVGGGHANMFDAFVCLVGKLSLSFMMLCSLVLFVWLAWGSPTPH